MGFFNKSVVVTADSIDNYNAKLEALNKKQDETTKKYNEGKIGLDEYNKSIADGKSAIDDLNKAHSEVQKGLDITNDKQMSYKDKIIAINKLKLNTSEYDLLIKKIQESNGELLKNIRLQQIALKSKMTASMAEGN